MTEIKPIHLVLKDASALNAKAEASLSERFTPLAAVIHASHVERYAGNAGNEDNAANLTAALADFLGLVAQLDQEYGADGELPLADAAAATDEALRCAGELDAWLDRFELGAFRPALYAITLGIGLWAMRHGLPLGAAEPIVNALAYRANEAGSTQETAATYALMQGFIAHLAPQLNADLERSNPERPWRVLNLNFAITAIRSGDVALMRFAFDTLNDHLPDERAGFYAEAHAVAVQPGFPAETRALIEAEYARWAQSH